MTTKRHSEKKLAVYSECFLEHKVLVDCLKKHKSHALLDVMESEDFLPNFIQSFSPGLSLV